MNPTEWTSRKNGAQFITIRRITHKQNWISVLKNFTLFNHLQVLLPWIYEHDEETRWCEMRIVAWLLELQIRIDVTLSITQNILFRSLFL